MGDDSVRTSNDFETDLVGSLVAVMKKDSEPSGVECMLPAATSRSASRAID
jgi:hypothetical protein